MNNVGYKLFKVKASRPGEIFPLYVFADTPTPISEWVTAENGPKTDKGKVKSKLGDLCYRPGWHLSDLPSATHIGIKDETGKVKYIKPDTIWCEVEYSKEVDYQSEAEYNGRNKQGVVVAKNAFLTHIPENGFYRYKTNPQMMCNWIIAGAIKVRRIMTDQEVNKILEENGVQPMERYGGNFDVKKYGFAS